MNSELIQLYDDFGFIEKYKNIATRHITNRDSRLKKSDKKRVLEIFEKMGYKAKYDNKERFYKVRIIESKYDFYFHIDIKYGLFELLIGVIDANSKKHLIGGGVAGIYDDILVAKQINEERMPLPSIGSYEDLESILKESLSLYEDFKKEVLKLKP